MTASREARQRSGDFGLRARDLTIVAHPLARYSGGEVRAPVLRRRVRYRRPLIRSAGMVENVLPDERGTDLA